MFLICVQIEHGVRPHSKNLTEYFSFLLEFAKMGEEECAFLTNIGCITTMVNFYMGQKQQENYVSRNRLLSSKCCSRHCVCM
jgi:hypothetical protein